MKSTLKGRDLFETECCSLEELDYVTMVSTHINIYVSAIDILGNNILRIFTHNWV